MKEEYDNEIDIENIGELRVSLKALNKMFSYARAVNTEIGGLLLIDDSGDQPLVKDALIFQQTVTGASVELDAEELGKQMEQVAMRRPSKFEMLKGWWHSHNNFDTFWSGVDDECFENFLETNNNVYGIVVNKAGSMKARIDIKTRIGTVQIKNIRVVPHFERSKLSYMNEARRKIIKEGDFNYEDEDDDDNADGFTPVKETDEEGCVNGVKF